MIHTSMLRQEVLMDTKGFRVLLFALAAAAVFSVGAPTVAQTVLVAPDAAWKYLDDGSDPGMTWRAVRAPAGRARPSGTPRAGARVASVCASFQS